jgi:hypothetical protein
MPTPVPTVFVVTALHPGLNVRKSPGRVRTHWFPDDDANNAAVYHGRHENRLSVKES